MICARQWRVAQSRTKAVKKCFHRAVDLQSDISVSSGCISSVDLGILRMRLYCAPPNSLYTNVMDGLFLGTSGPFSWLSGTFLVTPSPNLNVNARDPAAHNIRNGDSYSFRIPYSVPISEGKSCWRINSRSSAWTSPTAARLKV